MPADPDRHLRAVGGEAVPASERSHRSPPGSPRPLLPLALAGALALVLGLWFWSRAELTTRVRDLEAQVGALEGTLAERDRVIDAQRRRFEAVGTQLDGVQSRLEAVRALVRESDAD